MHEIALMSDILTIIEKDWNKRNLEPVNKVSLIVGELSNAMPDALSMAFDIHKTYNYPFLANEVQLVIRIEKALAKCTICGESYEPDQRISNCPNCKLPSGKIIQGETFKIQSYESRDQE